MRKLVNRFKKLKNERGLTLVELLAVIVILAIIAIIAFVFIGGVIDNSRKDAHIANAQQIISAAKLYVATTGEEEVDAATLQNEDYLDQVLDPWNKLPYSNLSNVKVTKVEGNDGANDGGYQISGFKPNDTTKCKEITATEQKLAKEGRKLCE